MKIFRKKVMLFLTVWWIEFKVQVFPFLSLPTIPSRGMGHRLDIHDTLLGPWTIVTPYGNSLPRAKP